MIGNPVESEIDGVDEVLGIINAREVEARGIWNLEFVNQRVERSLGIILVHARGGMRRNEFKKKNQECSMVKVHHESRIEWSMYPWAL